MRLDHYFDKGMMPKVSDSEGLALPLIATVVAPMGMVAPAHWSAIYRLAYERTLEALKPTRYDRAMTAAVN